MKQHHAKASKNPPMTSVGQWAPAHTLATQARKISTPAKVQTSQRQLGLTLGASAKANMKNSHVKNTA
jgi:hypothetical protein